MANRLSLASVRHLLAQVSLFIYNIPPYIILCKKFFLKFEPLMRITFIGIFIGTIKFDERLVHLIENKNRPSIHNKLDYLKFT